MPSTRSLLAPALIATALVAPAGAQAGQRLLAAQNGGGTVAVVDVAANGRLTPVPSSPFALGTGLMRGVLTTPDARFGLVAQAFPDPLVISSSLSPAGRLASVSPNGSSATPGSPVSVSVTPNGRFVFVAGNSFNDGVGVYAVGANGGLTPAPGSPHGLAGNVNHPIVTPDGRFLFVTSGNFTSVRRFAIAADGNLTQLVPDTAIGGDTRGGSITPDGRFLYVADVTNERLAGFSIGAGGTLTPVPGATFATGTDPFDVAISPDGRFVWTANNAGTPATISGHAIGANGALTPIAGFPLNGHAAQLTNIEVSPDGRHVFTASGASQSVGVYAVGAGGGLTAIPDSPFDVGDDVIGAAALGGVTNQPPKAALTAGVQRKRELTFSALRSTDPDGTIARYDWDFGDGVKLFGAGPTQTHRYARDGSFRAVVRAVDDQNCSTSQVYTGERTLCNGSALAFASYTRVIDGTRPKVSRLKVGKRKRNKSKVTFGVSERGTATLKLERVSRGRKGKRRYASLGTKKLKVKKGKNSFSIGKRFGRRKVRVGSYRLTVTVKDAASNTSKAAKKSMRVR